MEKDDIKKLVLQAAQGNKAAFGALYEETGRTVYFSCLKLLGDPQLAEDITQETYLTALQKLGNLAQPENFPAWVNRIGINLCKMHFRNNSAPEDNSEEIIEEIPDEGLIPEEYVSNDAKRKIIMDIIDTVLTEEQRQSVILYYFDMLTVPEIAEVMNCTTGTVTSRLSAARKKIKEAVLIYEENNNDRLHAAVPVFILSKLLNKEASNTVLPKLTVFTGSASAANAVPDSVTTTKTISGGKGMFSTVKVKVIAGVCAAAVVGGGITAAVVLSSNGSKDNESELSVDRKLYELRAEQANFKGISFDTIAGYKEHAAIVHYEATPETDIPLKPEGMLLLDSGAQYPDGTTDITRTIVLGPLSDEEKTDYTLVLKGFLQLQNAVFPEGTCGTQLDVLARQAMWKAGINYFHGTGHGVGHFLCVHEGPHQIRMNHMPTTLRPGMTVTNEPGIYKAGRHGIRTENTLLIVPAMESEFGSFMKFEPLTLCPIDKEAIVTDMLTDEEINWFNEYHKMVYSRLSPLLNKEEQEWLKEKTSPLKR